MINQHVYQLEESTQPLHSPCSRRMIFVAFDTKASQPNRCHVVLLEGDGKPAPRGLQILLDRLFLRVMYFVMAHHKKGLGSREADHWQPSIAWRLSIRPVNTPRARCFSHVPIRSCYTLRIPCNLPLQGGGGRTGLRRGGDQGPSCPAGI